VGEDVNGGYCDKESHDRLLQNLQTGDAIELDGQKLTLLGSSY